MNSKRFAWLLGCLFTTFFVSPFVAFGDEGMWLFSDLPVNRLKEKYGFEPTEQWADHLMRASVRFNSGGSGSFISSNGLVLTNHHVGEETIQKLSSAGKDYYTDGFLAKTLDEEQKAPDLELNQLVNITDVTERVNAAIKPSMSVAEAAEARRAVIANIVKAASDETGLRCDVITLYGGGRYHLYQFKKYTDVRLVWAPEAAIAFFGGDADNFEYPRYCLDACIFRVYENNEPAKVEHFLKWSQSGADVGELVFVSGNPGSTSRIYTHAALEYERDVYLPYVMNYIRRLEIMLQIYGQEDEESARRARGELLGVQNSRKARMGMLQGLQDPTFMNKKLADEKALLEQLSQRSDLKQYADAWNTIAEIQAEKKEVVGRSLSIRSPIFDIAEDLVRIAAEDQKPNEERIPTYRESNRESLERQLFSEAPLYRDFERAKIADGLSRIMELRGGNDPLVLTMLDGQSPQQLAEIIAENSKLFDVSARKKIAEGGQSAIESSDDPMIQLVVRIDQENRRIEELVNEIDEKEQQAYAQIAEALFATQGTSTYPDATFSLRLSYGTVKTYQENGETVPAWTTIGGAFEHEKNHNATEPWQLPNSWHNVKSELDLDVPLNFICTADIIGGNSGSPVVNQKGELVGLIFDGNIQSLPGDYYFDDTQNRSISVHSSAIRHALKVVYGAENLVDQLGK
jgi:hypothetical protein